MSHRGHRGPMNRKIEALPKERNAAGNHDRVDRGTMIRDCTTEEWFVLSR